jgi:hypothetical protein
MLSVIHAECRLCRVFKIKPFLLSVIMLNVSNAVSQIKPFLLSVAMLNVVYAEFRLCCFPN